MFIWMVVSIDVC